MAASYDYGVTSAEVLAKLPLDATNIGATGEPLNTGDIDDWINEAAAKLNSMLDKSGITASAGMDADAHDSLAAAVRAYALMYSALALGLPVEVYNSYRDGWHTVYSEYSNRPQQLGDSYADGIVLSVDNDTTTETWNFVNTSDDPGSGW